MGISRVFGTPPGELWDQNSDVALSQETQRALSSVSKDQYEAIFDLLEKIDYQVEAKNDEDKSHNKVDDFNKRDFTEFKVREYSGNYYIVTGEYSEGPFDPRHGIGSDMTKYPNYVLEIRTGQNTDAIEGRSIDIKDLKKMLDISTGLTQEKIDEVKRRVDRILGN